MRQPSMRSLQPLRAGQRGVVLVLALIFLMLITILAVSASSTSLLQQHLAGALRSSQMANMGAESAAREAEWRLWTASITEPLVCTTRGPDCYKYDATLPNVTVESFRASAGWTDVGSSIYQAGKLTAPSADKTFALAKDPVFMIEDLGIELPSDAGTQHESGHSASGVTSTDSRIYRITARSAGANDNTVRVLETTFAAKAN
jgi:type IV pilus assembly protein PilX